VVGRRGEAGFRPPGRQDETVRVEGAAPADGDAVRRARSPDRDAGRAVGGPAGGDLADGERTAPALARGGAARLRGGRARSAGCSTPPGPAVGVVLGLLFVAPARPPPRGGSDPT